MWSAIIAVLVAAIAGFVLYSEHRAHVVHKEGIVLITGASTGIGRHAAEFLADNYNFHVLAGVRKESDAKLIEELNLPNLKPILLDVTSHESCSSALRQVQDEMAQKNLPFVALVNNAGIAHYFPIEYHDMEDVRSMFDTNFFGMLDMTQQFLPLLRNSKGRIVMISSIAGFVSAKNSGIYAGTKFAMEAISDAVRREVAPHGISVSVVQPGYVSTAISANRYATTQHLLSANEKVIAETYPQFSEMLTKDKASVRTDFPATTTTPAIVDALVSEFPKTRYPVAGAAGVSATMISWIQWLLTDRLADKMM
jgi:short-subunit dehydrogenase